MDTCLRRCPQESNSLQHLNRSRCQRIPFTHIRSTHGADFLICAPRLKGHFTHAANIEVASGRSNHDCVLAASLTRSGGFFHCMDLLLGALRRHVCTLTTMQTSLGSIRTFATSLALLTTLGLGLRTSRRSTHTWPDDQPVHTFGTFCQSEDSLQKCDPCFRTWNLLAESDCHVCQLPSIPCYPCQISPCPLLHCPSVSAVTEQRYPHEKSQPLRL